MLGYLYQCRLALLRALQEAKVNASHSLTVERFDDISFDDEGTPLELIQSKHHGQPADASDNSVDVWRTIRIWAEHVAANSAGTGETRFVLVTTEQAADDSALSKLRQLDEKRDPDAAQKLLEHAAATSKNKATKKARDAFLGLDPKARKLLVHNIWVFDNAPNITDTRAELEEMLFYSVPAEYVEKFVDHLEGWWFSRVVLSLAETPGASIPLNAILQKTTELREQYKTGGLPLDEAIDATAAADVVMNEGQLFVRQLQLIGSANRVISSAAHDYYRAFTQRSRWAREQLLLDDEVNKYDRSLLEAWRHKHDAACEDSDGCEEEVQRKYGRDVYRWATEFHKPLRNRDEQWLSVGSFHMLSDEARLGWHPRYEELIKEEDS